MTLINLSMTFVGSAAAQIFISPLGATDIDSAPTAASGVTFDRAVPAAGTAHGDYAIYTKSADTLKVTGNVVLQRGQNVANGNLLVDQVHAGLISLTSDVNSANKGRVRAVMYPDKKTDGTAAPASKP